MQVGKVRCLEATCDGMLTWTLDGGTLYLDEDGDGNSKCPTCGTDYILLGEDWEVSRVYIEHKLPAPTGAP